MNYCVYLTTYSGHLMPNYYIGSTSKQKIKKGYKGSVSSKTYKDIWNQELKDHPELFFIKILSEHETRNEALIEENRIQKELDVVKDPNYINLSFANKNGFFGRDVSGENNPNFGRTKDTHPEVILSGQKISIGRKKFYLENPDALVEHGKRTSTALKNRTKETHDHVRRHSEFMKSEEGKKAIIKAHESRKRMDQEDPFRIIRRKEKRLQNTIKKKLEIEEIKLILDNYLIKTNTELKNFINNKIDIDKINFIVNNKEYWNNYINGEL